MLFLEFQIGAEAYVLDTAQIVEVLPLVSMKRIPQALLSVQDKTVGLLDERLLFSTVERSLR